MGKISYKDAYEIGLSRRSFVKGGLGLAGMAALSGCGSSDSSGSSSGSAATETVESDTSATVTFAITTAWESFNPYLSTTSYSNLIQDKIFDRPVYVNEDYEVEPRAASSWELEDDTTLVFHLDENATFHDGEPVTAEDWVFTLQVLASSEITAVSRSITRFIEGCDVSGIETEEGALAVEARDDYTVVITLNKAYSLDMFMYCYATSLYILPAHLFEDMTPAEVFDDTEYWEAPIGSGPCVLEEVVSGNSVTLSSFEDYELGQPQFAQLVFKVVSKSNFANSIMAGEVDLTFSHITYDDAQAIDGQDGVVITKAPHPTDNTLVGYNHNVVSQNMRKAINYAIDKANIIEQYYSPDAYQVETMVMADNDYYVDHTFERDTDTAAEYLQAAIDAGEWTEGDTFLLGGASEISENIGALIVQNLADIGLDCTFTMYDSSTMWSYLYDGTIHAVIMGLTPSNNILGIRAYYESMYKDSLWFHIDYEEFDDLIADLEVVTSEEEEAELVAEFQDAEAEIVPFSMIVSDYPYSATSERMVECDEFASYSLNNAVWNWVVEA